MKQPRVLRLAHIVSEIKERITNLTNNCFAIPAHL